METGHGRFEYKDAKWTSPKAKEILTDYERGLYDEYVHHHEYRCFNKKTTVVIMTLHSAFEVTGTSGCENPENFSEELGHLYAVKDGLRKLSEFAAFYRAEKKRWATPEQVVKLQPELISAIKKVVDESVLEAAKRRHLLF